MFKWKNGKNEIMFNISKGHKFYMEDVKIVINKKRKKEGWKRHIQSIICFIQISITKMHFRMYLFIFKIKGHRESRDMSFNDHY